MRDEITPLQSLGSALNEADVLLWPRLRPARLLPRGFISLGVPRCQPAHTSSPAAASGKFPITPLGGLMIWTLLVFGSRCSCSRGTRSRPIGAALDRRQNVIEELDPQAPNATRQEADQILAEYRERLKEAPRAGRGDRHSRAAASPRTRSAKAAEKARERGEQLLEQTRREIPGQDAQGDRRDPRLGREPDRAGGGEAHAQDARPKPISGASSKRRSASSTSRRCPGGTPSRVDGSHRGGLRAGAARGRHYTHGKPRCDPRAARPDRRRARQHPRHPPGLFFSPYFLTQEETARAPRAR